MGSNEFKFIKIGRNLIIEYKGEKLLLVKNCSIKNLKAITQNYNFSGSVILFEASNNFYNGECQAPEFLTWLQTKIKL